MVFGSLESPREGINSITSYLEPELILGHLADGRPTTLYLSSPGFITGLPGLATYSHYTADTVFVGEHFEKTEDLGFERLNIEYIHLEAWAHESGFEVAFLEEGEEPKRRWTEVKHEAPESFTASVGGEYEVTLEFGSRCKRSQRPFTEVNITQPAELVIGFLEKQPYDRLSDIAFRLQHLFTLGMRRSAYPVAVRGYTGVPEEAMPVEVHYSPLGRTADIERPELHKMLFSRRSLPGGFDSALARWLEGAEKLDPVYRLFLGTVYNPSAFIEQQFLSLVTALEVYHRRSIAAPNPPEKHDTRKREILEATPDKHRVWLERELRFSHEPNLEARLHEIFGKNLEVTQAIVGRKKKARADFIKEVVNARNYRAHFDERLEGRAARGVNLHPINQKLTLLLEGCLMAEIGFEADEIKNAILSVR
jgi:hypothetical protein